MILSTAPAALAAQETVPPLADADFNAETEANRTIIEQFARLFWVDRNVREAFMTYVHPDYIQHNPIAADGRDNAITALSGFFEAVPTLNYEIHRIIVDGNLAAVHTRMRMNEDDRGSAVVDIFRIENGLIVEHWDVIQAVPEESANDHPMF
ncbi:nuclear transport factor 2 family protein [Parasphingopyxis marina]|uniref:Nuclear transport factor 2 family protein n=1 Tax=Parasphingopyxis marina TaxID=2761622 RepID=A0A842I0W1_9SPHN|nr:nuclear transport factor 2 family protein [Parasphingopyxis marina]MBC2777810.1 nuclear transport factor 2 family protein [Parasphingopyxis marina]